MSADWWLSLNEEERRLVEEKRRERQLSRHIDPLLKQNAYIADRLQKTRDNKRLLKLNPGDEPSWTLGMVLAWIATRELRIVANMWEQWAECNVNSSSRLAALLAIEEVIWGGNVEMSSHQACEALFSMAKRGKIEIRAVRATEGIAAIRPEEWDYIAIPPTTYDELPWKLGRIPENGPLVAGRYPMMNSTAVLELWKARGIAIPEPKANEEPAVDGAGPGNRGSAQQRAIDAALLTMWPNGCPVGLTQQQVEGEIIQSVKNIGGAVPSPRTIQRYFAARRQSGQ